MKAIMEFINSTKFKIADVKIQIKTRVLLVILVEFYNQVNVYMRTQNGIVHRNQAT